MKLKDFLHVYKGKYDIYSFRGNVLASNFNNYPDQHNVIDYEDEVISEIVSVEKGVHIYLDFA